MQQLLVPKITTARCDASLDTPPSAAAAAIDVVVVSCFSFDTLMVPTIDDRTSLEGSEFMLLLLLVVCVCMMSCGDDIMIDEAGFI
jgi:hypothetical protein